MNIKKIVDSVLLFTIKRLMEIVGFFISCFGILIFLALFSYSPDDPNFIFQENTKIQNWVGFQGSYTSDLFFQSIGLISYLIPITFIFTGFTILLKKEFFLIFRNSFYIILYSLTGSVFFTIFYNDSFNLYINGNGGFVGNYLNQFFFNNLNASYEKLIFYILILAILVFFLLSINFKPKVFYSTLKKIVFIIFKKNNKNYTNKDELIDEYIPQEEIKNLIQEDLPFIKAEINRNSNSPKFQLPSFDLLKKATKKERDNSNSDENNDPAFLEKILLDFGVNGNIKKVSHGPVVTLNEFEPAAGVKVSKIINLSDDIARNTSSESARISTIPGSSTIGIELPNSIALKNNHIFIPLHSYLNKNHYKRLILKLLETKQI